VIRRGAVVVNAFATYRRAYWTGPGWARDPATGRFLNTADALIQGQRAPASRRTPRWRVATNAALTKEQANKLAQIGHDACSVISPVHTMIDGDTYSRVYRPAKATRWRWGRQRCRRLRIVKRAVPARTGTAGIAGSRRGIALGFRAMPQLGHDPNGKKVVFSDL